VSFVIAIVLAYVCGVGVGYMAGTNLARADALRDQIQRELDRLKRLL
jgi:uncharacterized membrane-anchored protein YhcB (DUF1043 family)